MRKLAHWPRLSEENLHAFRLSVKRLSVLLKQQAAPDRPLLARLDRTRRSIGDWHDWAHLAAVAHKHLSTAGAQSFCASIDRAVQRKLVQTTKTAQALQAFLADEAPAARKFTVTARPRSRKAA